MELIAYAMEPDTSLATFIVYGLFAVMALLAGYMIFRSLEG